MFTVSNDHGTTRPSTTFCHIENTSLAHCGSNVQSDPGACSTPGGISHPLPSFSRCATDKSKIPLSPLFQFSRHQRTCSRVVSGVSPINVYGKLFGAGLYCGGK